MNNHKISLTILLVILMIWLPAQAKFTVGFWGDCRSNSGNAFEEICGYLLAEKGTTVDVHWQNGDFTSGGSSGNWAASWGVTNARQACIKDYFFMCTSNHDANEANFKSNMTSILPSNGQNCLYYHKVWDIPGSQRKLHLFSVDLYMSNSTEQIQYFAPLFVNIDPDDWICGLWHAPTYGELTYKSTNSTARNTFAPLLSRYGGDFVLNGHAHVYRRTHVLNESGTVAEQTGGPGSSHVSPDSSEGLVHIVNGRGGVFSSSSDGSSWSGTAYGPPQSGSVGLVTLMEFDDNKVNIQTINIGDNYKPNGVLDTWTWTRGTPRPAGIVKASANLGSIEKLMAYPNPLFANVTIETSIPGMIAIYDIKGQCVANLVPGKKVVWDGRNKSGQLVPSGNYLIRVMAGNKILEKIVTLIR
jgi:hypothetical protein